MYIYFVIFFFLIDNSTISILYYKYNINYYKVVVV